MKTRRNRAKSAVRKAIRYLLIIQQANEVLLGADELSARIRRYVAAHEAPRDDQAAFATLCGAIFAQGIGFEVVEKHRAALQAAFCGFSPEAVAQIDEVRVGKLLDEPIIRNRAKIESCIQNARRWREILARRATYLGRVAETAASDDAASGWPKLAALLQEDFCRLGESTARIVLKRWGFFSAVAHPGAVRVLTRLRLVDAVADGPAAQLFVGSVAEAANKDAYSVEAALAVFAGAGPCRSEPRCSECPLNEDCPSAQVSAAAAL